MTAGADGLAGGAIAGVSRSAGRPWLIGATPCLYAGGVVLNDFFDRGPDARERPEPPPPNRRVPAAGAAALGTGLLIGGVALAFGANATAGAVASATAATILLYDTWAKHQGPLGPVVMGACR